MASMSFASNVECSICSVAYTNEDTVYATSCGHIYHFACMQEWQSRSTSCPHCRYENPETFRLYLDLQQDERAALNIQELKCKVSQLEMQLAVSNSNLLAVQQETRDIQDGWQSLLDASELKLSHLEENLKDFADLLFDILGQNAQTDTVTEELSKNVKTSILLATEIKFSASLAAENKQLQRALKKANADRALSQKPPICLELPGVRAKKQRQNSL